MSRERKDILKATEWIALLVVMHYCAYCFMRPTSFVFEYSPIHRKLTFLSLALVGSFRLLVGLWREFRESGINKALIAKILLIGVSGICCLMLEIRFEYTGKSGGGGGGPSAPKKYTLTYETFGGTEYEPVEYKSGADAAKDILEKLPVKAGYLFEGWYSQAFFPPV